MSTEANGTQRRINDNTSTTTARPVMLESANGKPHNTSHLLNIDDIMAINPSLLPTIDESFYTNLVSRSNNRSQIVVRIPEEVDDAYTLGDQYVQRLMNDGNLPATFKQRNIKRNTHSFNPDSFKLTAYPVFIARTHKSFSGFSLESSYALSFSWIMDLC